LTFRVKKKTTFGALLSILTSLIIIILIISSSLDFFLSNTFTKESLIINPNLGFEKFYLSASIFFPNPSSINYCSNTIINSTGLIGDLKSVSYYNQSTFNCISTWSCSNCSVNGFSQEICYNYVDNTNSPIFTNVFFTEILFTSVIKGYNYVINNTILSPDNIIHGNLPSYVYVSLFNSIYKQLISNKFSPILYLLNYLGPILNDVYSFGLIGFITGNKLQTNNILEINSNTMTICYSIKFSPSIYYIEQDYKQNALNFFSQIASLTSICIFIFSLLFCCIDRVNVFITSKIKKKKKNLSIEKNSDVLKNGIILNQENIVGQKNQILINNDNFSEKNVNNENDLIIKLLNELSSKLIDVNSSNEIIEKEIQSFMKISEDYN
jgi:hypothetical protein